MVRDLKLVSVWFCARGSFFPTWNNGKEQQLESSWAAGEAGQGEAWPGSNQSNSSRCVGNTLVPEPAAQPHLVLDLFEVDAHPRILLLAAARLAHRGGGWSGGGSGSEGCAALPGAPRLAGAH